MFGYAYTHLKHKMCPRVVNTCAFWVTHLENNIYFPLNVLFCEDDLEENVMMLLGRGRMAKTSVRGVTGVAVCIIPVSLPFRSTTCHVPIIC